MSGSIYAVSVGDCVYGANDFTYHTTADGACDAVLEHFSEELRNIVDKDTLASTIGALDIDGYVQLPEKVQVYREPLHT